MSSSSNGDLSLYTQDDASDSHADLAVSTSNNVDKSSIADLVAKHGSASATAWLEFERYTIWQASDIEVPPGPEHFAPIVGYMHRKSYVFAWGNPLVSDASLLAPTVKSFVSWVQSQDLNPVWCCVDRDVEQVLAQLGWSGVECIYQDVLDPAHVLDMTGEEGKGKEGAKIVKDLKKNLRRAERAGVKVEEVKEWKAGEKEEVEQGVQDWKKNRSGVQIASTTFQPFIDEEHRRYWIARHENKIVGILILTPAGPTTYLIKNAASFPDAPRGTSEELIHTALADIRVEDSKATVSFGITASDGIKPVDNLSGWKVTWMTKVYGKVATTAGLLKRGDFRDKFDPYKEPMYVCYPQEGNGGSVGWIKPLLKVLKK